MNARWDEGGGSRPTSSFDFDNDETMVMRALPQNIDPPHMSRAEARKQREARNKRAKRGKKVGVLALLVLVIAVLGVGAYGALWYMDRNKAAEDFAGPGGAPVVIQINSGETASEIGATLEAKNVVASSAAFYNAAIANPSEIQKVQPGFYQVPVQSSAASALDTLVAPDSRVGSVVIAEGRQLHDSSDAQTGSLKKGIYNLISEASCVGPVSAQKCVSTDELNTAGASSDLASLGVPDWAMSSVKSVPDKDRQLEGLIAASSWDFDPTATPTEILRSLVEGSAAKYEATGILTAGSGVGMSPYQLLVAASLVEREALPGDMAKVARVIVNRLAVDQPLQFDSTVNYSLDTTEVATTDADRERVTPWNTYAMPGLPATPIASPSIDALKAVESPAAGDWLYFVTINKEGQTLFTKSYEEHLANIELAQQSGISTVDGSTATSLATPRKAAVLGSPIAHSKSPLLHLAAYEALGLSDWTYERIECTGEQLPALVDSLGPEWVGLSVTMPGKIAALDYATERTPRAVTIGSANTLVRIDGGWRADCTDVDGVSGALIAGGVGDLSGTSAVVVGAGGTARPALVALADMGVRTVTVVARDPGRASGAIECGSAVGLGIDLVSFDDARLGGICAESSVLVSTVPAEAAAPFAQQLGRARFVLDAIYNPWPTPLASAVEAAGGTVIGGLEMLLNQAFGQVEQFTGKPAPREAMAAAIA